MARSRRTGSASSPGCATLPGCTRTACASTAPAAWIRSPPAFEAGKRDVGLQFLKIANLREQDIRGARHDDTPEDPYAP
jgi:hypothetical protein